MDSSREPVDAIAYGRASLGRKLRDLRERAGLGRADLADRLGRPETEIAAAELGMVSVTEAYVIEVQAACARR